MSGYGQEAKKESGLINFFLDCYHCDFTFVRQELPFISFVRDPQLADVHILVTESHTGSGGSKFFLNFIGMKDFEGMDYEYTINTSQSDTDDDIRRTLLKPVIAGILPYYSKAGLLSRLNIDIKGSENLSADEMVTDTWKKWLFRFSSGAEFQKEESQNAYSVTSEAQISKTTEEWKTSLEGIYEINREKYLDNDTTIINRQDRKELSADFIKSITEKWSAGAFINYMSRTYLNVKNSYIASAGIEYNLFPWKECNRRVFAIRYTAGIGYVDYNEETLYDKMYETLFSEALEFNLELIQPWGEISVGLEGSHYFHDFSKNRLTLESDFSLRLTKHLSVYCEMQAQMIHDQIYLPKGDASHDDILLKRRKLATTYEMSGNLGLRFTFGSIYNNVVNERF